MEIKPAGRSKLTLYIGIALLAGIAAGFILNKNYVGIENTSIANADIQLAHIDNAMLPFETIKDTTAANALLVVQKKLQSQKKEAEKSLLSTPDETQSLAEIKILSDSIQQLQLKLAALTDTASAGYKTLQKQRDIIAVQKSNSIKSRDGKLDWFTILADIFLRLIKMIVAPLVFTTLVVGVAKLGDIKAVGRIGGKTLLWFISASLLSLLLGMLLVNLFEPGNAMHLPLPDSHVSTGIDKAALTLKDFFYHVFPASVIDAMAKNEILQIVVFALFFGVAAAALGEITKPVIHALDAIAHIILKVTGYVMGFAPVAVFGAMTAIIAKQGIGILKTYSIFIGEFYFGLLMLWIVLILIGSLFIKKRVFTLIKRMKEPILLAFSTSSSEAAFPKTMLELERFGCKDKIVSFVLPLGYSFNLDGSMMYMTFASLFIAQSYGMHMPLGTQLTMLLVLMLTSKGIAGVPRASLVVIAGTLATFNIPEAGIALLLGIDPLLDMGRSATNVVGNSIATAVVSKWEGELEHK
ncbi:dicarboxylate/amino acid:cation symporter [Ferruginibacter paludis]|uniref:dicarboxylate/amino acid:cation symporter n=1 Tax=Ferruginibacter paludis TaxID=1310417 RepID=UPI0025B559D3|nr:dicarboxylate/amino acid:cation symporter [Ferruginibacter paludis]MDN3657487.1 dicarboxylate/amino acid:cation symporter [Ferruginibacter paludis]